MSIRERVTARIRERLEQTLGTSEWQSPEASTERGVTLREEIPFVEHAIWQASEDRPDPVELLRSQGETRVQQLLPLRYVARTYADQNESDYARFMQALEAGEL